MLVTYNQLAAIGALLSGVTAISAFSVQPAISNTRTSAGVTSSTPRFMSDPDFDDSFPSDSSEDPHFTVEESPSTAEDDTIDVENKPSTASESVVSSIMDYLPSTLGSSGEISSEDRAAINEAILKLEALNPTEDPVYSSAINGVWTLRYAGGYSESKIPSPTRDLALFLYSGGYSPGLFALGLAQKLPAQFVELGDLEISISRSQPRIEAKIDAKLFGGAEETIEVKARLEVDSGVRFTETYESASVLGQTVDLPEALQYSRDLYVSYVDDDILVVRDGAGVPEILVRK
mmetsp:Transcript_26726/g.50666  ORF Transcript_26726/g.50666 Transcript_26726/m.50666 type:complete len:290 (+) Transcript_26726:169-1038(+)|eukprot:CAMPEP_0201603060 /NCGR_PEP_ID=MMETSP0492-20130828/3620_1 /ASSEMBLY_ACC=CAM_ASM_000837 /TAXON_ID=420259 /ORGANISM="Thalassiosira gravida, Strain GMp14c1" /LENGTH=289 /DNA_ID=CAMNT_0048066753 /DNA_START=57 /DNA_END=926 /DNA_ORIENTATION=+